MLCQIQSARRTVGRQRLAKKRVMACQKKPMSRWTQLPCQPSQSSPGFRRYWSPQDISTIGHPRPTRWPHSPSDQLGH
eukprot:3941042-Rhodomonas_salina.3